MTKTTIEWTDETWNPIAGCTPVSEGCRNCYAASMAIRLDAMGVAKYKDTAKRRSDGRAVFTGVVHYDAKALALPGRWRAPRRVFVNSMSDVFHSAVSYEIRDAIWSVMEREQRHTFIVLTKRPREMDAFLRVRYGSTRPARNVWVGTSVEDQESANQRIPHLIYTPAAVRFLSCEPLLGDVSIAPSWAARLHWVIAGAESGPRARPMDEAWVRHLRTTCMHTGMAFFYKQNVIDGKKISLPVLDGRQWAQYPEVRT